MTSQAEAGTRPTGWTVDDSTFSARLALVRQRMGWNVKEAARECGLPGPSWRDWEMHEVVPRRHVEIALQIATRTGCDYIWLLTGDRQRSTLQYPLTDPLAPRILERGRTRRTGRTPVSARPAGHVRPSRTRSEIVELVAV